MSDSRSGSHSGSRFVPPLVSRLVSRISRLEWVSAAVAVVVLAGLVVADPDIVQAPFESPRAIAAVVGGTILAAVALVVMLQLRVPPVVRVLVLGVPLVATSWWLISPFFTDDVVREKFDTSIAAAQEQPTTTTVAPGGTTAQPAQPSTPQLLGAGKFVGLAGHKGTGDAGVFRLANGSHVVRLENFHIDNGPDLEIYLVPGADRRSPTDRSHHFGALRGNIGDQTYEVPSSFPVTTGPWTVLVWCRAFAVEFVAATITVT
jgi:hypothetical protein